MLVNFYRSTLTSYLLPSTVVTMVPDSFWMIPFTGLFSKTRSALISIILGIKLKIKL